VGGSSRGNVDDGLDREVLVLWMRRSEGGWNGFSFGFEELWSRGSSSCLGRGRLRSQRVRLEVSSVLSFVLSKPQHL